MLALLPPQANSADVGLMPADTSFVPGLISQRVGSNFDNLLKRFPQRILYNLVELL